MKGLIFKDVEGEQFYYSPLTNRIVQIPNTITPEQISEEQGKFNFSYSPELVRRKLRTELDTLILESTQNCNLRCFYCIYGGSYIGERTHRALNMDLDTARKQ